MKFLYLVSFYFLLICSSAAYFSSGAPPVAGTEAIGWAALGACVSVFLSLFSVGIVEGLK